MDRVDAAQLGPVMPSIRARLSMFDSQANMVPTTPKPASSRTCRCWSPPTSLRRQRSGQGTRALDQRATVADARSRSMLGNGPSSRRILASSLTRRPSRVAWCQPDPEGAGDSGPAWSLPAGREPDRSARGGASRAISCQMIETQPRTIAHPAVADQHQLSGSPRPRRSAADRRPHCAAPMISTRRGRPGRGDTGVGRQERVILTGGGHSPSAWTRPGTSGSPCLYFTCRYTARRSVPHRSSTAAESLCDPQAIAATAAARDVVLWRPRSRPVLPNIITHDESASTGNLRRSCRRSSWDVPAPGQLSTPASAWRARSTFRIRAWVGAQCRPHNMSGSADRGRARTRRAPWRARPVAAAALQRRRRPRR